MSNQRRSSRVTRYVLPLVLWMTGCQPSPVPDDNTTTDFDNFTEPMMVAGTVELPNGMALDKSGLVVATNIGDGQVGATGRFEVQVISNAPSLATAVNASGEPILLGFLSATGSNHRTMSARSTAQALLYFAVGGFLASPDQWEHVLELVDETPECDTLTAAIEQALVEDAGALLSTDGAVAQALTDAHAGLLESAMVNGTARTRLPESDGAEADGLSTKRSGIPTSQTVNGAQVLLAPDANTRQSGVQILQNPGGAGIIAQNNVRRRAAMYAYKVATVDEAGETTEIFPPERTGDVIDIPTTFRLEIVSSIQAALAGTAPWAPLQTPAVTLPKEPGTVQTKYEIVVLGATLNAFSDPPIFNDSRFFGFADEWNDKIDELASATFIFDFALPVIELIGVGATAQISVNNQAATLSAFRETLDPLLLRRGLALPLSTRSSYAQSVIAIVDGLVDDVAVLDQLIVNLVNALGTIQPNTVRLQNMQTNLRRAQRAGVLLTAIQLAISALDIGAVINDLQEAEKGDSWSATVVDRRVNLLPADASVTMNTPSTNLRAEVNGLPDEVLCYRWTLQGQLGQFFDVFGNEARTDGAAFVTMEDTVSYLVTPPTLISPGALDTVRVEVFAPEQADDGNGGINYACADPPAQADFIGEASITVMGREESPQEEDCDDGNFNASEFQINAGSLELNLLTPVVSQGDMLEFEVTLDFSHPDVGDREALFPTFWVSGLYFAGTGGDPDILLNDGERFAQVAFRNGLQERTIADGLPILDVSGLAFTFSVDKPDEGGAVTVKVSVPVNIPFFDPSDCQFYFSESDDPPIWSGSLVYVEEALDVGVVHQTVVDYRLSE